VVKSCLGGFRVASTPYFVQSAVLCLSSPRVIAPLDDPLATRMFVLSVDAEKWWIVYTNARDSSQSFLRHSTRRFTESMEDIIRCRGTSRLRHASGSFDDGLDCTQTSTFCKHRFGEMTSKLRRV